MVKNWEFGGMGLREIAKGDFRGRLEEASSCRTQFGNGAPAHLFIKLKRKDKKINMLNINFHFIY